MAEIIQKVTGSIKPLKSGTRIRQHPNTFGVVLVLDCTPNDVLEVDEIITYSEDNAQLKIKKNDKWGHVIKKNNQTVEGWTAILFHQYESPRVCSEHYTIDQEPIPTSEIEVIGMTAILKYSDNSLSEPIEMEVKK